MFFIGIGSQPLQIIQATVPLVAIDMIHFQTLHGRTLKTNEYNFMQVESLSRHVYDEVAASRVPASLDCKPFDMPNIA